MFSKKLCFASLPFLLFLSEKITLHPSVSIRCLWLYLSYELISFSWVEPLLVKHTYVSQ